MGHIERLTELETKRNERVAAHSHNPPELTRLVVRCLP